MSVARLFRHLLFLVNGIQRGIHSAMKLQFSGYEMNLERQQQQQPNDSNSSNKSLWKKLAMFERIFHST